jgi:hypothetical protein
VLTENNKKTLSPQERYSKLATASSEYMRGKITLDQLREEERIYETDYDAIFSALLRIRVSSKINRFLRQFR